MVYIEPVNFKCHPKQNAESTLIPVEDDFFDGKCDTFIEGYRLKPDGETLVREDGIVFSGGKMISPWKPSDQLFAAQAQYEADLAEAAKAYREGVESAWT